MNGCCYGSDNKRCDGYIKVCGAMFWELVTGDKTFYVDLVEPLGFKAKERNEEFYEEYGAVINRFTQDVLARYSRDGKLDWVQIVNISSKRTDLR